MTTALHIAVENSMKPIIYTLIDLGANPTSLDKEKRKPVERIDYTGYNDEHVQEIVDFLSLTEMTLFGSVTSFVDASALEEGRVSKSLMSLIQKSVASLVSPKGSQSELLMNEASKLDGRGVSKSLVDIAAVKPEVSANHKQTDSNIGMPMLSIDIPKKSNNEPSNEFDIVSNEAVVFKKPLQLEKIQKNTDDDFQLSEIGDDDSPLLSFDGDDLAESVCMEFSQTYSKPFEAIDEQAQKSSGFINELPASSHIHVISAEVVAETGFIVDTILKSKVNDSSQANASEQLIAEQFIEKINSLNDAKLRLEKSLEDEIKNNQVLERKIQEAQIQSTELNEELSAAIAEMNDFDTGRKESEIRISSLSTEIASLQNQNSTLKSTLNEREKCFYNLEADLNQEKCQRQKLEREALKFEVEMTAIQSELYNAREIISSRDDQLDSFRNHMKSLLDQQRIQTNTILAIELNTVSEGAKIQVTGDIVEYYESAIRSIAATLENEYQIQNENNTQYSASKLLSLQLVVFKIQSMHRVQSKALESANQLKLDMEKEILQLKMEASTNKSTFENTLKLQKAELSNLTAVLEGCEKSLELEKQQKSELQVAYNQIHSELKGKIESHQREAENLQKLNSLRMESLAQESESNLQAAVKELETSKKTTEKIQRDFLESQAKLQHQTRVLEELQKVKNSQDAQISDLQQKHESTKTLNGLLQAKLVQVESNFLDRLKESNIEIHRLEHENTQLLKNITLLNQNNASMEGTIGSLGAQQLVWNESPTKAATQARILEDEVAQQTQALHLAVERTIKLDSLLDESAAESSALKSRQAILELQVSEKLASQKQMILDQDHGLVMTKIDQLKTESLLKETLSKLQTTEENFKDASLSVEELSSSLSALKLLNLSSQEKLENTPLRTSQSLENVSLLQDLQNWCPSKAETFVSLQTKLNTTNSCPNRISSDSDQSRTLIEALKLENRELIQKGLGREKELIEIQALKNTLLLKSNDLQKEVAVLNSALQTEAINRESLQVDIDRMKSLMSHELNQERNQSRALRNEIQQQHNEIVNLTAQLNAERANALKYNSIRGHLYSLSSIANLSNSDPSKTSRVSETPVSNTISTETLTDENIDASRTKLSKNQMKETSSLQSLNGLRSAFAHEAQTVVMRLSNLEEAIQSDTSKMASLLHQINSDSQIEREIKEIMKGVFGTQRERSLDELAAGKRIIQNSLNSLDQEFKETVHVLETANSKQTMEINCLQSEKEKISSAMSSLEKTLQAMEKDHERLQRDADVLQKDLYNERRQLNFRRA
ncbi:UNVERIFIED_CONTAM: hypothetical protein HDU68_008555 [Siphonaria sp. JEL0065]|nr:hypothetical protein HDU68_008555 [Siphonaria sp. JEL0065]